MALFPELAAGPRAPVGAHGAEQARAASRQGRAAWQIGPGLLQTPPFRPGVPWISGTVHTVWRGGVPEPGWIAEALAGTPGDAVEARASRLAERLRREHLGGAFWAPPPDAALRPGRVLVAPGPDPVPAAARLRAALDTADAARTVLLGPVPPGVRTAAERAGCTVLAGPADPWPLLDGAAAVHAVPTHPLALLARLAGVPMPGADWPPGAVAAAALLEGVRYADPFTGDRIECEAALDIAAEWRRVIELNRGVGALTGMSFWKRRRMAAFFHDGLRAPPHRRTAAGAVRAAGKRAVAAWSSRLPPGMREKAAAAGIELLRVEDGFVRSAGLGSGFLPPGSVVVDGSGIYYDPSGPSDLETLLRTAEFPPALLGRAQALIARLVAGGVTKYGAASAAVALPDAGGRRTVLVPGQVADDLSVRLGGAGVGGNGELLARVRAANPGAFVIYKPHPDVDAGHRAGVVPEAELRRNADLVLRGVPMAALIGAVDEVHTLTSLAGFEALLRGKRVVCHGQPFYAGWGLTEDLAPLPRRGRKLSLEELTAGLLLLYARYVDPVTELPCPAEVLLDRIAERTAWPETPLMRLRRWQGKVNAVLARRAANRAAP